MAVGGQYTVQLRAILDTKGVLAQIAQIQKQAGKIMIGGAGATKGAGGIAAVGKEANRTAAGVRRLNSAVDTTGKSVKRIEGKKLAKTYSEVGKGAKQATSNVKGFGATTLDVTKKVIQFGAVTAAIRGVTTGMGAMVKNVFDLDSALVEFKKVSDLSGKGLEKFTDQAYEAGKATAKTGVEMIDAATQFRKMGYGDQTSLDLAKYATMFQNVADAEISAGDAAKFINSQMKAYGEEFSKYATKGEAAAKVIDSVNEVANKNAVGTNDLQLALTKTSAAMSMFGNSYDQTIGIMTAGTEIMVGMPSQVARGWRTISANVLKAAQDNERYVAANGKVDISMRKSNGEMKNTYEIMKSLYEGQEGVSKGWKELSKEEQGLIATELAGKQNMEKFSAVMSNFGTAIKATTEAQKSHGSAAKENARYLDSLVGRLQALKSAWSRFANATLKSDTVKVALEGLTKALNFMASDAGQALIKATAGIVGFVGVAKLLNKIPAGMGKVSGAFGKLGKATATSAKGASKATGLFRGLAGVFSGGAVGWGILGAAGVAYGLYKLHTYLKEKYDPENQYKKTKEDLEALQKELKGVQEEKKELQKKVESGTATDSEERRLKLLERQEASLKRQIELQSQLERKAYAKKETGATKGVTKTDAYKKAYNKHMETPGMQPAMARKLAAQDIGATDKLASKTIEYKDALGKLSTATKTQSELQEKYNKAVKDGDDGKAAQYAKELEKADEGVVEAQKKLGDTFGDLRKKRDEWAERFGSEDKMPEHMRESYKEADKLLDAFDDLQSTGSFEKLKGDGLKRVMNDFKDLGDTMGITLNEAGEINSIDFGTFTTQMENAGFSADETRQALSLISQENPTARVNIDGIDVSAQNLDLVLDYLDKVNGNDPNATVEINGTDVAVSEIGSVEDLLGMIKGEVATPNVKLEGADDAQKKLDEMTSDLSEQDKKSYMASIGIEGIVDTKDEIESVNKEAEKLEGKTYEPKIDILGGEKSKDEVESVVESGDELNGSKYTGKVEMKGGAEAAESAQTVKNAGEGLNGKTFLSTLQMDGAGEVAEQASTAQTAVASIPSSRQTVLTANTKGAVQNFQQVKQKQDAIKSNKTSTITAQKSNEGAWSSLKSVWDSIKSKVVTITANKSGDGFAKGTRNAPEGFAEVNEQGWEFIRDAKTGRLRIAGGGKRTVTVLGKGDAVYTHQESKRMLGDTSSIEIPQHAKGKKGKKAKAKKKAQEAYNKAYEKRKSSYEAAVDKLEHQAAMGHWSDKTLADKINALYKKRIASLKKWNKSKKVKKWVKKGAKTKKSFGTDANYSRLEGVEGADYDIRIGQIEKDIESLGLGAGDPYLDKGEANAKIDDLNKQLKNKKISEEDYKKYYAEINKAYIDSALKMYKAGKKNYVDMKADLDAYVKDGKITWAEYYEYIEDLMEAQLENEKKRLEKEQKLNDDTYSLARAGIERKIAEIKKENEATEEQNELIEKQNDLEKARTQRVKVYRQGKGFVYEQDTQAIKEATTALKEYKKEQDPRIKELEEILELFDDLEAEAEKTNFERLVGNTFDNLFGSYGTDKAQWTSFLKENLATKYGYENLLEEMEELNGWEAIQAFLDANGVVTESTVQNSIAQSRFASGSLATPAGFARVGEQGYEIALFGKGDAVMPHEVSENLMAWGSHSPIEYASAMASTTSNAYHFDKLVLPNVTDANSLLNELNNLPNRALQYSRGRA